MTLRNCGADSAHVMRRRAAALPEAAGVFALQGNYLNGLTLRSYSKYERQSEPRRTKLMPTRSDAELGTNAKPALAPTAHRLTQ